jgi:branched-chain amino acid transport system substrate-binding protein
MLRFALALAVAGALAPSFAAAADAPLKIGVPVGLTGYASVVDHAWRDGVALAADTLNASGGIAGHKIALYVEDNHSQPQDAVIAYRKMISSDGVEVLDSGCVTAGNFAAASSFVRAKIPNLTCGILPRPPAQRAWMFAMRLPAAFEVDVRYDYMRAHHLTKIGILYDSTPYSQIQEKVALGLAGKYGLKIVDTQVFNQDDADLSVQINHIKASGAQAIFKVGIGGSTVTAAKNVKRLGITLPFFAASDDLSVFRAAAVTLGSQFFFVAEPLQVIDSLPAGPQRAAAETFLKAWSARYGQRDGGAAAHAWDSVMILKNVLASAKALDGAAIREAIEHMAPYQGAGALYHFTADVHEVTVNPLHLAQIENGKAVLAK